MWRQSVERTLPWVSSIRLCRQQGVQVPNGFALTARAYRAALNGAGAWDRLHKLLDAIDKTRIDVLAACAAEARAIVFDATGTDHLREEITQILSTTRKGVRNQRCRRGA